MGTECGMGQLRRLAQMKDRNPLLACVVFVLACCLIVCCTVVIASGAQAEKQRPRSTEVLSQLLTEWQALQKRGESAEAFVRKLVREAFNEGSDAAYSMLWALRDSVDSASMAAAVNEAVLVFHERSWPRAERRKFSMWFMAWYERMPKDATFDSGYLGRVLYVSQVDEVHRLLDMLDDRRLSVSSRGSLFMPPLQMGWDKDVKAFGDDSEELQRLWKVMNEGEDILRRTVISGAVFWWPDLGQPMLEAAERTRPRWWIDATDGTGPLASTVELWTFSVDERRGREGKK